MRREARLISFVVAVSVACSLQGNAALDESCETDDDCQSDRCALNRCAFASCDADDDCEDGQHCKKTQHLFSGTSGECWPRCGSCPPYYFCIDGASANADCQVGLDMHVTPDHATAGKPLVLHVDVKAPPAPIVEYVWTLHMATGGGPGEIVTTSPDLEYPDVVAVTDTISGTVQTKDDRDRGATATFEVRVDCVAKGESCGAHTECCGYSNPPITKDLAVGCLPEGTSTICRSPHATFVIEGPTNAKVGQEVSFKAVENDELGGRYQYFFTEFDFGDGTSTDLVHDAALHTYTAAGSFTVRATPQNETTPEATLGITVTP
jgi:hypothetical protein